MDARAATRVGLCLIVAVAAAASGAQPASAMSRKDADKLALKTFKPPRTHGRTVVFGGARPLRAGSAVTEAVGPGTATPAANGLVVTSQKIHPLRHATWLYWEDDAYGAGFEHPSRLLLIDDRSGKVVQRRKLSFWPEVGGKRPAFLRPSAYLAQRGAVFSNVPKRGAAPAHRAVAAQAGTLALTPDMVKDDCLVAIGLRDDGFEGDIPKLLGWAQHAKIPTVVDLPPNSGPDDVARKLDEIAPPRGNCKDVLLYVGGHGYSSTASPTPRIIVGHTTTKTGDTETTKTVEVSQSNLLEWVNSHRGIKFKFLIDACYSGRFARNFGIFTPSELAVMATSSSDTEVSWGHLRAGFAGRPGESVHNYDIWFGSAVSNPNSDGVGEFTNGIVDGLYKWSDSPGDVQATGGDLAKGVKRAMDYEAGGDFAHQLNWTHPQLLDNTSGQLSGGVTGGGSPSGSPGTGGPQQQPPGGQPVPPPPPLPDCDNGVDDADPEDTLADFPADPGCLDVDDTSEKDALEPAIPCPNPGEFITVWIDVRAPDSDVVVAHRLVNGSGAIVSNEATAGHAATVPIDVGCGGGVVATLEDGAGPAAPNPGTDGHGQAIPAPDDSAGETTFRFLIRLSNPTATPPTAATVALRGMTDTRE
jgi:hypothetical protein